MCLSSEDSSLISTRKREVMEIFPPRLITFLEEREIQALVLVSLSLQIILSVMGNKRKYWTSDKLSIIMWIAYLSADWTTTVSLSVGVANGRVRS